MKYDEYWVVQCGTLDSEQVIEGKGEGERDGKKGIDVEVPEEE